MIGFPEPEVLASPGFAWPDLDLPFHGFATFRTAAAEFRQLNRTVGTFTGVANAGTGRLMVEAQAFVPSGVAAAR